MLAVVLAAPASAQSPVPAAAVAEGVVVTVVEAGAEPRAHLRYQLDQMGPQSMVMDMRSTMTMNMGFGSMTQAMPTIRTIMRISEVTPLAAGNARIAFALDSMEALPSQEVEPMVMNAIQAGLGQVGQMSGWIDVDSRGAYIDGNFELSGADPSLAELLSSMEDSMNQMTIPFPEEPVGQGARWTVDMAIDSGGMSLSQTATYELRSRNDEQVELAVSMTQAAGAQTIEQPGMPSVELTQYSGSGQGTTTVRFAEVVPTAEISIDVSTTTAMDMGEAMGGRIETSMQMRMDTTIRPGAE